jgi:hypothetical protein
MTASPISHARPRVYRRAVYIGLALGTITLGLIVHFHGGALRPAARDVIGDALWAAMIAWWVAAIAPDVSLGVRTVTAVAICFAVESSQLYHSAALDMLRGSTVGHLLLGSDFDTRDLVAYTVGVLAAATVESIARFARDHWMRAVKSGR